ncbi:MAG TPA: hypothetical protein VGE97_02795 [Nitrososphaera sp.]|jgi:hypothetical protein
MSSYEVTHDAKASKTKQQTYYGFIVVKEDEFYAEGDTVRSTFKIKYFDSDREVPAKLRYSYQTEDEALIDIYRYHGELR